MEFNKSEINTEKWPSVNPDNLDINNRTIFLNRKYAIDDYVEGALTVGEICEKYNIIKSELYRLLDRCLETDENGRPFGYVALIPYKRLKKYKRSNNINGYDAENDYKKLTGAFEKLLKTYPALGELIRELVSRTKKNGLQSNYYRPKDIHKKFVKKCNELNISIEKGEYPFNTSDIAKRSLYRYIRDLKESNPGIAVKDFGDSAISLFNNTGVGEVNNIIERPFERVEFDGHKIDISLAVRYTTLEGDEVVDTLHRIWILAVIDSATTVTLGYKLVLDMEYSAKDVLECFKNAIFPHKSPTFTIKGLKAPEKSFPSQVMQELEFAVWDEIAMDNAKANHAKMVKEKSKDIIGCNINYGPVGTPTRRPLVEKLFDLLEENGFHRNISTTGNSPNDPRRKNSEEKAVKYEITVDEIEQLVEVLIANINNKPKKTLNSLSPIETMVQRINRNMPYRTLEEKYRDGSEFTTIFDNRTVRGSMEDGRRPYIHYEGVDYRNDILAENYSLVKTKLTLKVNIDDLRFIFAYLPDGSELGLLKAKGKWSIRKHSLKIRKTINKLVRLGELKILFDDDPMEKFDEHLIIKAKNNKAARNQIAKQQMELQKKLEEETNNINNIMEKTQKENTKLTNIESLNSKRNELFIKKTKIERFSFNH